jgi:hypothetical protein
MSTSNRESIETVRAKSHAYGRVALRVVFGDRRGLALFLGALCFYGLYWRLGAFITDTNAIANTLVNVADGQLAIVEAPYGSGKQAPGTFEAQGRAYGRSYGIVFLAVPVLWLFEGLSTVLEPQVVVFGLWSLVVVGFTTTLGRVLENRAVVVAGSGAAVVAFAVNLLLATPLAPSLLPFLALQVLTLVATALVGVICYRLVATLYGPTLGLLAGGTTLLATPLAFWASLPKRHSFVVLVAAVVLLAVARSRTDSAGSTRYRMAGYASIGLLAWVHPAEALVLFIPFAAVDLATAPSNDRRTLGTIGLAFLVSLLPFFLTNLAITGNPLKTPRMLSSYTPQPETLSLQSSGGSGGLQRWLFSIPVVGQGFQIAFTFGDLLWRGIRVTTADPGRLYPTFLRSGFIEGVAVDDDYQAISLTVLESAPMLAGLVGLPLAALTGWRDDRLSRVRRYVQTPRGATDLVVLGYALLLVVLFIPKLPNNAQVTVRYLHPLYLLGVYGLVRLAPLRQAVTGHWRLGLWSYTGTVFVGGQLLLIGLAVVDPGLGEAVQLHALLALAGAAGLAGWTVVTTIGDVPGERVGVVLLGLTAGLATVFVLLSGLEYFAYAGEFALPASRVLSEALPLF